MIPFNESAVARQHSMSTSSSASAAVELTVVVATAIALRVALRSDTIKSALPRMPVLDHAWLFLVSTLLLFGWIVQRRGGDAAQLGIRTRTSWRKIVLIGVLGAIASVALDIVAGPLIRAAFGRPDLHRFTGIEGNLPVYLILILSAFLIGGLGEELLYRGIIFTRLRAVFGSGRAALIAALVVQGAIFGLVHSYQGTSGMVSVGLLGVLDGVIFVASGYSLWPVVIAHGLLDTLGFTLMYLGLMKS